MSEPIEQDIPKTFTELWHRWQVATAERDEVLKKRTSPLHPQMSAGEIVAFIQADVGMLMVFFGRALELEAEKEKRPSFAIKRVDIESTTPS